MPFPRSSPTSRPHARRSCCQRLGGCSCIAATEWSFLTTMPRATFCCSASPSRRYPRVTRAAPSLLSLFTLIDISPEGGPSVTAAVLRVLPVGLLEPFELGVDSGDKRLAEQGSDPVRQLVPHLFRVATRTPLHRGCGPEHPKLLSPPLRRVYPRGISLTMALTCSLSADTFPRSLVSLLLGLICIGTVRGSQGRGTRPSKVGAQGHLGQGHKAARS